MAIAHIQGVQLQPGMPASDIETAGRSEADLNAQMNAGATIIRGAGQVFRSLECAQFRSIAAASLLCLAADVHAQMVWNLAGDWSDAQNPNGVWSYNHGGSTMATHTSALTGDTFSPSQPAWVGSQSYVVWFRSVTTTVSGFTPDWQVGDVITHTQTGGSYTAITWTSPITGLVDVSGAVWAVRDIGRSNNWSIWVGTNSITGGSVGSGDIYNSGSPFDFALGSGGASILSNIPVSVGTVIQLRVGTSGTGDYAGVDFSVTAVPEPSVFAAIAGIVSLGLAGWSRRHRHAAIAG